MVQIASSTRTVSKELRAIIITNLTVISWKGGEPVLHKRSGTQLRRMLSTFVGLCYVIVSLVLPFQHHHQGEEAELLLRLCTPSPSSSAQIPSHTRYAATARGIAQDHCLACEWQATNLSPALPVVTLASIPVASSQALAKLPHTLRSRPLIISSRGPPVA